MKASLIPASYAWLTVIVALFFVLALAYARATPAWQAPDEPAHFNYVEDVADHAELPVLRQGDYPSGLVPLAPSTRSIDLGAFRYEAHQPPLFYLLGALVYKLHSTLMALRALSILFGAALLPVAYLCVRALEPAQEWLALGVAAFIAFIPMHLFDAGTVENDTLADLILALALLAFLARWPWLAWGVLLGLAVLTKLTIYVPVGLLFSLSLWERAGERVRGLLTTLPIAIAISAWWLVRNGLIYGWTDILVQQRQALVAGSQTQTAGYSGALEHFVVTAFESFWGQFGWMSIPLPQRDYVAVLGVTALAIAGWIWARKWTKPSLAVHVVWWGVLLEMAVYNLKFVQPQGRYLFPALVPIGLFYAGGVANVFPKQWQATAVTALSVAMLAFAAYVLRRDLMPAFQ